MLTRRVGLRPRSSLPRRRVAVFSPCKHAWTYGIGLMASKEARVEAAPQLFLTLEAEPGQATIARLQAALAAAPVASVRLVPPAGAMGIDAKAAGPLVALIQDHGTAALIDQDAGLAHALRADGVHIRAASGLEEAYVSARERLGPARIVGIEIVGSRHDAMSVGEMGADYIAFSGPERDELVAWWSEIFVIPCVALGIAAAGEAAGVASAGADFVGLTMPGSGTVADVEELVRTVVANLVDGFAHSTAS